MVELSLMRRRSIGLLINGLSQKGEEKLSNSVLELFGTELEISMIVTDIKSTKLLHTQATSGE